MILSAPALTKAGFVHAFSTRADGNLSPNHGTPEHVMADRQRWLNVLGHPDWPVITLKQIHSDTILMGSIADGQEGDALISTESEQFIGVKTADCTPVLIGDPITKAFAAIHAGWRGTLLSIVKKTVEEMTDRFNSHPENLVAAIGPSACGRCYEVGPDVASQFQEKFSDTRAFLIPSSRSAKFLLNGSAANATQLISAGVRVENIHVLPQCTMHDSPSFFSHRKDSAANLPQGRQLSIIGRIK